MSNTFNSESNLNKYTNKDIHDQDAPAQEQKSKQLESLRSFNTVVIDAKNVHEIKTVYQSLVTQYDY